MTRLVRMASSQHIGQKVMVSIICRALETEFKAYFLSGNTNTTYFTRFAQYLGTHLKGVEALGNDVSVMDVGDVDEDFLDRFPVFAGAVEDHVLRARNDLYKLSLVTSSEEHDDQAGLDMNDSGDEETCPFWAFDEHHNAPRGA